MESVKTVMQRENVFDIVFLNTLPELVDEDLTLRLAEKVPADHNKGFSPSYEFNAISTFTGELMGEISLRIGRTHHERYFRGNIGFHIYETFRGHHYAARSCRLVIPIAKHHQLDPIWITCNPDNYASKRSIELAGAEYVETVTMPANYPYFEHYRGDSRVKCRYRLNLS
jgi:tagatose 1,6-diphosphate aldolase